MKTKDVQMRKKIENWLYQSNHNATEFVLTCMTCLMLLCVMGIVNSFEHILYIIVRSYFAVFISSFGIRYMEDRVGYRTKFSNGSRILFFLISAYMIESSYFILTEVYFLFCRWLESGHLIFLFFFIFIWHFYCFAYTIRKK